MELGSSLTHDTHMTRDGCALALAARQGGVITLPQALGCGLSMSAIKRRVRRGDWQRLFRSVYRLIDMVDPKNLVRAAIAALPSAIASHETAAELHAIPSVQRGMAVVSVHTRSTHTFPGVTVHRNHDLSASHSCLVGGIPATSLPRTVFDMGQIVSEKQLRRIVDDLIAQRRVTVEELRIINDEVAKRGKPGSTSMRSVLAERAEGAEKTATRLELKGLAVLREAGLPEPVLEYPIPWNTTKRFDAAYPEAQVAIEWDSLRWHGLIDSFERDRRRDRAALLHGWSVLRFTWKDVTDHPLDVVTTVRAVLQPQIV